MMVPGPWGTWIITVPSAVLSDWRVAVSSPSGRLSYWPGFTSRTELTRTVHVGPLSDSVSVIPWPIARGGVAARAVLHAVAPSAITAAATAILAALVLMVLCTPSTV